MSSKAVPLAVALLLLLSGCGGLFGETTPTPPSENRTNDSAKWLTPGLTSAGVENAETLARTHRDALRSQSRTTTLTRTYRAENGTAVANTSSVTRAAAGRGGQLVESEASGPARSRVAYFSDSTVVWYDSSTSELATRTESDSGEIRYSYRQGNRERLPTPDGTYTERLYEVFSSTNLTVAPETVDSSVHRLEGSTSQLRLDGEQLSNVTFTARVDYTGVVRSYELRYETDRGGLPVRVVERFRVSDVGSTDVERPDWVETAENRSSRSASV
ncbi:hypothetical protein AUR64_15190 [Haloprofundus marisrubri]|uniref:Uncharacterized protein n=1 Tax=Haloprofundus marisrubri TaxID=1514971 RepID=A0A0W1R6S1_9EURY|nr:hypothetical protein [Haloprofundus marisrubri]KTG09139.1 hypothetical protein AUR64_15190 [Haloprofundus marisrubri]